ncbi:GNAT family N-acetyltransferase [Streptomyces sp. G-G2]|uniref:GNAT family N-acetyltransferase n=1 Tax=Streptomyces sp. G-G2 TaxID=3046201 RepID=UPI0024BA8683|nr:GNAT family N-acetyltransferase [Streptomyces sp. G-G2]MDJ0385880.1 GNAT family N-acetyltransferase [Streptomyces sp. G-G2]
MKSRGGLGAGRGGVRGGGRASARWSVVPEPYTDPASVVLRRAYYAELAGRYYDRTMTQAEIDEALIVDFPDDDLVAPTGEFLVGRLDGEPLACGGLRLLTPESAELTRVYVDPRTRGTGGGAAVIAALEDTARALGAERVVLDTRSDLVEARTLYAKHGYDEIPAYNDSPYAEHWFAKPLR